MMAPPPRPVPAPGATSPATVAPQMQGQRMRGYIGATIAIKYLESLVPLFGATTDEGSAVLKALSIMAKKFGSTKASPDLQRQELKTLGEQVPPAGPPGGADMAGMVRQGLAARGMGGAAPSPPAPPTGG